MAITVHDDYVIIEVEAPMLRRWPLKYKIYKVRVSRKEWDMNPGKHARIDLLAHRLRNMQETEARNGEEG